MWARVKFSVEDQDSRCNRARVPSHLNHLELRFGETAQRAFEIFRHVFPARAGRDAFIGQALLLAVEETAIGALPGFEGRGLLLVAFLLLVVQMSDVLQYMWGMLFGRRPIAPLLSPSKTWEGFAGGILTASLLGAALWWVTPFSPLQAAALAFAAALAGFLGGLVMSAIKRERGVKDWSRLIEGHGGIIDRVDSLIFAAPIFFHVVRYGWGR